MSVRSFQPTIQGISSNATELPKVPSFKFESQLFNVDTTLNAKTFFINYRDHDALSREATVGIVNYLSSIRPVIILQEIDRNSARELPFQHQQNIYLVVWGVDWDKLPHLKEDCGAASGELQEIEQIAKRCYAEYNKLSDKLENNLQRRIDLHDRIHRIAPGVLECCKHTYYTKYCSPLERNIIVATFLDNHGCSFEQSSWELSGYEPEIIKRVSKLNKLSSEAYKAKLTRRRNECYQKLSSIKEYKNILATKKATWGEYASTEHLRAFVSALRDLDNIRTKWNLDAKTPVFIIDDWERPIQVKNTNISFKFNLSTLNEELSKNHRAAILTPY